jgi:hypothetical protein
MRYVRALGACISALLILNVAALVRTDPDPHPPRRQAQAPAGKSPKGTPLDPVIRDISRFVETSRGLTFKRGVNVTLLKDADFEARLLGAPPDENSPGVGVARALGFLEPDKSAADSAAVASKSVVGFYDPANDTLSVRGDQPTPYVRMVLAHELTHALQDQHFDLGRPGLGADDERDVTLEALAEGDAMRVEHAYFVAMAPDDQRAVEAVIKQAIDAQPKADAMSTQQPWPGERSQHDLAIFPYQYGPALVQHLIDKGGQPGLDAAFRDPPVSSEQVINVTKLTSGEPPRVVAAPPADGAVVDQGIVGEIDLRALLDAQWVQAATASPMGWGGGRYVAWAAGGVTCVRMTVIMDTPEMTSWIQRNLDFAAELHGHASVNGPGYSFFGDGPKPRDIPLTYTACGPPKTRSGEVASKLFQARTDREVRARYGRGASLPATPQYAPQPAPESAKVYVRATTTTSPSGPQPGCLQGGIVTLC